MHDSLQEAHDLDGLLRVLEQIELGKIELVPRDTREPSPFCYELLNADPYAFLDGGEIAERRTRAVATRRSLTVESVGDLGRLDPEAIERVKEEARPLVRIDDELHDVLLSRIVLPVCGAGGRSDCGMPGDEDERGEDKETRRQGESGVLPLSASPCLVVSARGGVALPASGPLSWHPLYTALAPDRRAAPIHPSG